ncbi:hypothetical protein BDZ85DRAFT_296354 [Elsinoe ampelina]|uniref:Lipase B n=1 Tax=Elsinoe ampelina TaxID=302913 RepID=A0A6A6GC54_9PEZI|nr:hypothetical protein BDZ85DRAFT_296354 [Elsinoe ampelina]
MRSTFALFATLLAAAVAIPAPQPIAVPNASQDPSELEERQIIGDLLSGVLGGIKDAVSKGNVDGILSNLRKATPTSSPSSVDQARQRIAQIVQNSKPANIFEYSALLQANGLISGTLTTLIDGIAGQFSDQNSISNTNPDPPTLVYPQRLPCDAPYTLPESSLRAAIYIPPTFTFGQKPPVILFPGTGNTGYQTFSGNLIPLLTSVPWADPIWINVPDSLTNDAQLNAQYAAYALNYIASLTSRNVTITAWSQGNINTQWALKYFPSTRLTTSDHIALSADYAGTINANFICPDGLAPCSPAVYQQQYLDASDYISALRSDGGDSAYVPTTSVYSALLDQIVQPQSGELASAFLRDDRGVGAANYEVQSVCAGQLAGSVYTHEGILYHPLAVAFLRDAMANAGPGRVERVDVRGLCGGYLAEGLGLGEFLVTENAVVVAGLNLLVGQPRTTREPELLAFAREAPGSCTA